MATEGGGETRERGPGGRGKNVLKKHWLNVSRAAERRATERAGELTFALARWTLLMAFTKEASDHGGSEIETGMGDNEFSRYIC